MNASPPRHGSVTTLVLAGLSATAGLLAQPPAAAAVSPPRPAFFHHRVIDEAGPLSIWGKCAADLNGDGRTDLLAGGWRAGGLVWYESPGWTKHLIAPASNISTDIEVADVDRDGRSDVIAITAAGLLWYRNPDWKPHPIIHGVTLHDIEVSDFDRDGDIDVVARNQNLSRGASGATLFLFRQVSPDNWSRHSFSIPDGEGLKAADLDGDGDLDVAINGTWLENQGDLAADWPARVFGPEWKQDKVFVATGDINGDGRPDIVLSPSEPKGKRYRVSWFEAPSDPKRGPWHEHIIDPDIETVQHFVGVADFNLDGQPDIATAAMLQGDAPQNVTIHLNGGAGARWTKQAIGTTGSHSMRIVDLDGDGVPSLFGANHQSDKVELWRNTTHRGKLSLDQWQRHVVDAQKPWKTVFITARDLDGDGRKDIVTGPSWYRNSGDTGGAWERRTIGAPLHNMAAVHDFDGDGRPDVLGTQWQGGMLSPEFAWARNEGGGAFTIHTNIAHAIGDFLQGVAVDRFAPNGPLEVALSWHNSTGRGIHMLTVPDDPISKSWTWRRISPFDQQEELTARDIDGDGRKDLVLGTRWLRNEKAAWTVQPLGDSPQQVDRHRDADINGDGRVDVVLGYLAISAPGKLVWLEMPAEPKSAQSWIEHVIAADVIGPMSLDVADLDGDGDTDVVVGEHDLKKPAEARLLIFENLDGKGGQWRPIEVSRGDEHHDGAQLADIDNDGDLDIVSIGWGHPRVLLYENRAITAPRLADESSPRSSTVPIAGGRNNPTNR